MPTENRSTDPRDLFISTNPNGLSDEDLVKETTGFADPRTHADYLVFLAGYEAGRPVEQRYRDPVAVVDESDDGLFIDFIYGENGNPLRRGDKLYTLPATADAGEVERLRGKVSELTVSAHQEYMRCEKMRAQLALQEALLNQVRASLVKFLPNAAAKEIAEIDAALPASAAPGDMPFPSYPQVPEDRQPHKKPGVLPRAHDASMFQRSAEPSAPAAPYPNRLCHIDYTAHPYLCGCLRGDEESQRIYDEYCRKGVASLVAASAEPSTSVSSDEPVCRGAQQLGTACGKCRRCKESAKS